MDPGRAGVFIDGKSLGRRPTSRWLKPTKWHPASMKSGWSILYIVYLGKLAGALKFLQSHFLGDELETRASTFLRRAGL